MIKPIFTAHDHKYQSKLGTYTSVTTLLHLFEPKKDFDEIAKKYVDKRTEAELIAELSFKYHIPLENVYNLVKEVGGYVAVKKIWKDENIRACEDGTAEHLKKEKLVLSKQSFKTKSGNVVPLGMDTTPVYDLSKLEDGVYSELLIWNNNLMIAGQADLVLIETINGVRYCRILDYKTNKVIKDYNYVNKSNGKKVINEHLLYPLDNYCNCNYWLYQFQLNIYAWLLGQYGFSFGGGVIIHITENDKKYPLLDLQNEVGLLMKHWEDVRNKVS